MIQLGQNIYTNFKIQDIPERVSKKVRAIVMGFCGSGKTSLFNKLCDKQHPTGYTGESLTRDIDFEDVVYIQQNGFRMYDTPGTDSVSDALHNALILRASLTCLPINLIMISAKLCSRYMTTLSEFKQLLKILKGYEKLIVCLVSHLDISDNQLNKKQIFSEMADTLKKEFNSQLKMIVYSNITSDFEALSKILFAIGLSNRQEEIKIVDKTFFKYFHLSCPAKKQINDIVDKYTEQIIDQAEIFFQYFKNFKPQLSAIQCQTIKKQREVHKNVERNFINRRQNPSNHNTSISQLMGLRTLQQNNLQTPNTTQIISELKQFMKFHLRQLQLKQYKQFIKIFNDDRKTTDVYLAISQLIQAKLQQFQEECDLKFSDKKFYSIQGHCMTDVKDLIKECPHCHLVWMKTLGCDKVTCGRKATYKDYLYNKQAFIYNFKITNGKISYTVQKDNKYSNLNNVPEEKTQVVQKDEKRLGCGKKFNWTSAKRSKEVQEKLKELFEVGNFAQIKLEINGLKKNHKAFLDQLDKRLSVGRDKILTDRQ